MNDIVDTKINYQCNTDACSLGSPIILLENNKVIGIHCGTSENLGFNFGILLIQSIIDFQKISEDNNYKLIIKNETKKKYKLKKNESTLNNDIIIDVNAIIKKSIKTQFSSPPLIGLTNLNNTCYINATLQCLCNIENFVDYFKFNKKLKDLYNKDTDKSKLFSSFKLLIENLYPNIQYSNGNSQKKSFSPFEIYNKIKNMYNSFQGYKVGDPKDLLLFFLNNLHNELNLKKNNNQINNNNNQINPDKRNQNLMLNIFLKDFRENYGSIISDLFYGSKYIIKECI